MHRHGKAGTGQDILLRYTFCDPARKYWICQDFLVKDHEIQKWKSSQKSTLLSDFWLVTSIFKVREAGPVTYWLMLLFLLRKK